jgi:hypothetical protein
MTLRQIKLAIEIERMGPQLAVESLATIKMHNQEPLLLEGKVFAGLEKAGGMM